VKKFNGGYSCTCPGWIFQIKNCGVQACSCKHLRYLRGDDVEEERCLASAGPAKTSNAGASSSSSTSAKNTSVAGKLSLAHAWKSGQNPHGYFMSEKLDGMRAYWTGGKLWTRNGNVIHAPDWFVEGLPAEEDLDGELFLGRQQFDACMSIARRSDASEEWKKLKYVVFDCPSVVGGIRDRLRRAQELVNKYHPPYAVVHPQEVCQGEEHLLQELARVEQLGGEGMMLRHPTAKHRGGRTNDLLKVKSFADDEGLVIDYEEGKGKYTGMVGSLICITKAGLTFKVGSGLSDDQRSYSSAPKKGTVITYKYFELTKDGIPRFPTFMRIRPDVGKSAFPTVR
jgi:DNA ligase-1